MKSIREELEDLKWVTSKEYGQTGKDHKKNMTMYRWLCVVWLVALLNLIIVPVGWIFLRALGWRLLVYTFFAVIIWASAIVSWILVTKEE